jgi:CRP-like cAMP-binding protein
METVPAELLEELGRLALFVDLPTAELEAIARSCDTASFGEGEWIIREGDAHSGLYMIVEGEVTIVIEGEDRRVLSKGSFFGEISVLLDEPASASIVVRKPVTCLTVPSAEVEAFLVSHPWVMYRMLRVEARRLKTASSWRT